MKSANVGLEKAENDNSDLAKLGLDIIEKYVKAYLRTHFSNLPEGWSLKNVNHVRHVRTYVLMKRYYHYSILCDVYPEG